MGERRVTNSNGRAALPSRGHARGWSREFSGCSVFLNSAGTNATIALKAVR